MAKKKQLSDLRVIDNALNTDSLLELQEIFNHHETGWYKSDGISSADSTNAIVNPLDNYYFVHLIYLDYKPVSSCFDRVAEILMKLLRDKEGNDFRALTRIKANFYPRTTEVQLHPWHCDTSTMEGMRGALLSLNTCDGFTGFADGTEVDSVENRLVLFDATKKHHSTSCSNAQYRLNINVNYV